MSRKGWFIVAGICGMAAVLLVALGLAFLASRAYQRLTAPRTLGGPVAIVTGNAPKHGFLGIDFREVAAPLTIRRILDGSGAAHAGLRPGDVIVAAGSEKQPDLAALRRLLQDTIPGDEFPLRLRRGPREIEVKVRLMSFGEYVVLQERERAHETVP